MQFPKHGSSPRLKLSKTQMPIAAGSVLHHSKPLKFLGRPIGREAEILKKISALGK